MQHPDKEIEAVIIRLSDALCKWERNTGIESVLIIRQQGGFVFRAVSGKPVSDNEISDERLIELYTI
jgi:hypothetical protein